MTYAICEPRNYEVIGRYKTQKAADNGAVHYLKGEQHHGYPIDRLACVVVEDGDLRGKFPEEKATTVYRWLHGKRTVEVERIQCKS